MEGSRGVTHVERQHLHRGVEELVPWVLNIPTAEEVSTTERENEEGEERGEEQRK